MNIQIRLRYREPVEYIPADYISVALDVSQIVGGYWWDDSNTSNNGLGCTRVPPLDLGNEKLVKLTKKLSPQYLRIGGTEADRLYYSFKKKKHPADLPDGYHYILDKKRWKDIEQFCANVGTRLMITVNAGPGPRLEKNRWRKKNANHLIKFSETRKHGIQILELGNEVNAYPFFMGLSNRIPPAIYAGDISRFKKTVNSNSKALIAGPALAVWPVLGETLPFMKRFLRNLDDSIDLITWHYYPQQSSRSPAAVRRAGKKTLLKPSKLDEAGKQAMRLKKLRDKYKPDIPIWLGETGHAQCGGEPGLSDTFYSGFWWLDQLGLMALCGQKQVIRQTLTGGDYGLLYKRDYSPLPDYWITLLWNRYAGEKVYGISPFKTRSLRLYIHSLKGVEGGYCLIFINLDNKHAHNLIIPDELPPIRSIAVLSSPDIYSRDIRLNSEPLTVSCLPDGPVSEDIDALREFKTPPLSYGFLLLFN